jgi:membrane protease YdiL (CAAX protease family)
VGARSEPQAGPRLAALELIRGGAGWAKVRGHATIAGVDLADPQTPPATVSSTRQRVLGAEVLLLLGVSLGANAIYSVLDIIEEATRPATPLSKQTTRLNVSVVPDRPWLDLAYQLAPILFTVLPALLAIYLLSRDPGGARRRLGLDLRHPGHDIGVGAGLAALIGIPGLGVYFLAVRLGLNTTVAAANYGHVWWAIPVLIGSAAANGWLEEVVVVGYLVTRLQDMGWQLWAVVAASALLRGSYHLYQGFGGFVGNAIMGVIFALIFWRTRRVLPLVIAHTLIDSVAYVGYTLLHGHVSWL